MDMKIISLTQGKEVMVDDMDYEWLSNWKWHVKQNGCGQWYACRLVSTGEGVRGQKRHTVAMHRVILHAPNKLVVDHCDGNGLNNQRHNLRLCTHRQNIQNSKSRGGSSKYKGVSWSICDKKWKVSITFNGKKMHQGTFTNEEEAARAYDKAAAKYFKQFARTNEMLGYFPKK